MSIPPVNTFRTQVDQLKQETKIKLVQQIQEEGNKCNKVIESIDLLLSLSSEIASLKETMLNNKIRTLFQQITERGITLPNLPEQNELDNNRRISLKNEVDSQTDELRQEMSRIFQKMQSLDRLARSS